jgi:hypothetical protein
MGHRIDPSKSIADFDAVSLTNFALIRIVDETDHNVELYASLRGGFGRIYLPDIGNQIVEENIKVDIASKFSLTISDLEKLEILLARWKDISLLLRYLDFGDSAMIIEDGEHFITLPNGNHNIDFDILLD